MFGLLGKKQWARTDQQELAEHTAMQALLRLDRAVRDFDHTHYDEESLHNAAQEYIDLEIRLELVRTDRHEVAGRRIRRSPVEADLVCFEGADHVSVLIPAGLPRSEWRDPLYHELWHLIAGHPLPFWGRVGAARQPALWQPPRTPVRRIPPFDLGDCAAEPRLMRRCERWCEADADQAVEHLRSISAMKQGIYESQGFLLGLK